MAEVGWRVCVVVKVKSYVFCLIQQTIADNSDDTWGLSYLEDRSYDSEVPWQLSPLHSVRDRL